MNKLSVITAISLLSLLGTPQIARANNGVTQANAAEAASVWQSIIEQDANNAIAHYNLGIAFGHQAKWDEAIAAYRTAIQLNPELSVAYINLGKALTMTDELQEATRAYQAAIRLDPGQKKLVYEHLNALVPVADDSASAQ